MPGAPLRRGGGGGRALRSAGEGPLHRQGRVGPPASQRLPQGAPHALPQPGRPQGQAAWKVPRPRPSAVRTCRALCKTQCARGHARGLGSRPRGAHGTPPVRTDRAAGGGGPSREAPALCSERSVSPGPQTSGSYRLCLQLIVFLNTFKVIFNLLSSFPVFTAQSENKPFFIEFGNADTTSCKSCLEAKGPRGWREAPGLRGHRGSLAWEVPWGQTATHGHPPRPGPWPPAFLKFLYPRWFLCSCPVSSRERDAESVHLYFWSR